METLFQGDGKFCERDACSEDPCYPGVSCYDTDAEPFFRCGPCPEGYRGDGVRCLPSACQQRPPPCFQVNYFVFFSYLSQNSPGYTKVDCRLNGFRSTWAWTFRVWRGYVPGWKLTFLELRSFLNVFIVLWNTRVTLSLSWSKEYPRNMPRYPPISANRFLARYSLFSSLLITLLSKYRNR